MSLSNEILELTEKKLSAGKTLAYHRSRKTYHQGLVDYYRSIGDIENATKHEQLAAKHAAHVGRYD
jgi:hypothetical protein